MRCRPGQAVLIPILVTGTMIGHFRGAASGTVILVLGRLRAPFEAALAHAAALAWPADGVADFVVRTPMVAHDGRIALRMRMPPRHDRMMRQGLAFMLGNNGRAGVDRVVGTLGPIRAV